MNTQDKIKELIVKYSNPPHSFETGFVKDLESLLECDHKRKTVKRKGTRLVDFFVVVCKDCNKILNES